MVQRIFYLQTPTVEWFFQILQEMTNKMQNSLNELLLLTDENEQNLKMKDVEKQQNEIAEFRYHYMFLLEQSQTK